VEKIVSAVSGIFVLAFILAMIAYGLLGIGIAGDQVAALTGWGSVPSTMLASFSFLFLPPLGLLLCFFGAKDEWGWAWWQALLFTAPGLGLMVLVIFGNLLGAIADKFRGRA
jgi:hypothetical protein